MKKLIIFIYIIFYFSSLFSNIVRGSLFIKDDKKVYFLSVHHDLGTDEENISQLEILKNAFMLKDKKNELSYVLVERPSSLYQIFKKESSVECDVDKYIKKANLKNIRYEDIEVRKITNAIYYLFIQKEPSLIRPDLSFDWPFTPPFEKLTFKHLDKEYLTQFSKLLEFSKKITNKSIYEEFRLQLNSLAHNYALLKNIFKQYGIFSNNFVLETVRKIHDKEPKLCKRIGLNIKNNLYIFLDINIFYKIISLSNIKDITIIAGLTHTQKIQKMLHATGWEEKYGIGTYTSKKKILVNKKELDDFLSRK